MKPAALADATLHPAVLALFRGSPPGRILDVPAGPGALAYELLRLGYEDIDCLDIQPEAFVLRDPRVRFRKYDASQPLPFPDGHFDYAFSIEGIEHFETPWTFVKELCRVVKPGGKLIISTPNTFSVDARLKYLVSGYFPRFRPLMQTPDKVLGQNVDDAHVSPIYFWQLNFFLLQGGVRISRIEANTLVRKRRWLTRAFENMVAGAIRRNVRRRGLPDPGVTSDAVLFGDCIILEGMKSA